MKTLYVFINGLCDVVLQDLGGKTPLDIAKTPALDQLCELGRLKKVAVDLESKYEAMYQCFCGQAPCSFISPAFLEACSAGWVLQKEEVVFSLRFVSLGQEVIIDASSSLLSHQENAFLCERLSQVFEKEGVSFFALEAPKALLKTSRADFMNWLGKGAWKLKNIIGREFEEVLPNDPSPQQLQLFNQIRRQLESEELNALRAELEEDLVNGFFLSDGGQSLPLPNPRPKLDHLLFYSEDTAAQGLMKFLGASLYKLPPEQGLYDNLRAVANHRKKHFENWDTLVWDIDYIWTSSYQGALREKVKRIEFLDQFLVAPLLKQAEQENFKLVVSSFMNADIHQGAPLAGNVPYFFSQGEGYPNGMTKFSEKNLATCNHMLPTELLKR